MDIEKAQRALIAADAAGDVEAATAIAKALKAQRAAQPQQASAGGRGSLDVLREMVTGEKAKSQNAYKDNALGASTFGVQQGLTGNFGDELFDAVLTPVTAGINYFKGDGFDLGKAYDQNREFSRNRERQVQEENPLAFGAGQVAGGVMSAGKLASGGATLVGRTAGQSLGKRALAGAGEGAAYGAVYGAGDADEGGRLGGAAEGAATGALVGGALPVLGSALKKPFEAAVRKSAIETAPTNEALRAQAKQLYQQADNAGVQFAPQGLDDLIRGVSDDMATGGYNARLNPKVDAVLEELGSLQGQPVTLDRLEQVRRVALNAAKSNEPSDRMLAGRVIENIDQFVEKISPSQVIGGGNKTQAFQALQGARQTWKTLRKSEILDEAVTRAEAAGSGFENGLRNEFRSIYKSKKLRKMFSKDELNAILRVVNGGPTENTLKFLGKFGLPIEGGNNALGSSIGGAIGAGVGGLLGPAGAVVGAAGTPVVASGARKLAEAATRRNADIARALVRGGKIQEAQIPQVIQALENGSLTPAAAIGSLAATNQTAGR